VSLEANLASNKSTDDRANHGSPGHGVCEAQALISGIAAHDVLSALSAGIGFFDEAILVPPVVSSCCGFP